MVFLLFRVATQQGRGAMSQMWRVQFEKMEGGDRWTNPLMVTCNFLCIVSTLS